MGLKQNLLHYVELPYAFDYLYQVNFLRNFGLSTQIVMIFNVKPSVLLKAERTDHGHLVV